MPPTPRPRNHPPAPGALSPAPTAGSPPSRSATGVSPAPSPRRCATSPRSSAWSSSRTRSSGRSPPSLASPPYRGVAAEENMEQQAAAATAEAAVGMDPEEEGRLRSFLLQLRSESGILDRMIYKNKNQHRRCPYFQSLLKVKRDVRLLLSAGLEGILKSAFQVIHGKNPAQRVYHLERLKDMHSSGKHNFQERLLGVARLLSQSKVQ